MNRLTPTLLLGLLGLLAFAGWAAAQPQAETELETYLSANGSDPETTRGASRLLRYDLGDFPVSVYVPAPAAEGVAVGGAQTGGTATGGAGTGDAVEGEAQRREVIRAFEAWQEAVPDIVAFDFVEEPDDETLVVSWEALPDNLAGSYRYAFSVLGSNEYRFRATRVILDPQTSSGDLYRFALLQVGHALGLLGRSPFEGDALSAEPSGEVSARDVATLRALYALPSGTVLREE